jgi:hexosaminidase
MKNIILILLLISSFCQAQLKLIPYPQQVTINSQAKIDLSKGYTLTGTNHYTPYIQTYFDQKLGWKNTTQGIKIHIQTEKLKSSEAAEAYEMEINPKEIRIKANANAGLFYGIQTLLQLGIQYGNSLPTLSIADSPRLAWRAYLLDEARYFQGKEAVFKILDDMALLKMNVFHWHLTDDAGWRIEIKKYPLLTEIGSKRDSSQINDAGKKWASKRFDGVKHEGFYTQKEIREIVAYAQQRNITIVPEINMPGHASAAVASYPFLGTSKETISVPTEFGVVQTVFDVTDPKVIQFFHDVLREVAELFPGKVIHIGGDEVKFHQWEASPAVRHYMQQNKLKEFSDLQVHFTNNISVFLDQKLERRMMGWNEILGVKTHDYQVTGNATTELSKNAIMHFWKGTPDDFNAALLKGYQIVNSNHSETYIDYTYENIPLQRAYAFEPVPAEITPELEKNIIGLGCQMWGEWTPTFNEVTFQTFPRIATYAETGWSNKDRKDYTSFLSRLEKLFTYWESKGYSLPPREVLK